MRTQFNKTIKQSLLLIAIALILPSLLFAGGPRRGGPDGWQGKHGSFGPHHKIWENQQLIEAVGLSENQVKVLKEMDFEAQEKRIKLKSELDTLHLTMEKAFSQDAPDQKEILELAKKISDVKGQGFVQHIAFKLKMTETLTPEQNTKLKSVRPQFAGKNKRDRGSRHGKHSRPFMRYN